MNLQTLEYFPDVEQVEPRHSKANKPVKTVHVQLSSKQLFNHGTEERNQSVKITVHATVNCQHHDLCFRWQSARRTTQYCYLLTSLCLSPSHTSTSPPVSGVLQPLFANVSHIGIRCTTGDRVPTYSICTTRNIAHCTFTAAAKLNTHWVNWTLCLQHMCYQFSFKHGCRIYRIK